MGHDNAPVFKIHTRRVSGSARHKISFCEKKFTFSRQELITDSHVKVGCPRVLKFTAKKQVNGAKCKTAYSNEVTVKAAR